MNSLKSKSNYGWVILAASTLTVFFLAGLATTGFVVYQPYLISVGGLTNTQSSTFITVRTFFNFLTMLFSRKIIERFDVKRVMLSGLILFAIGFFIYGTATSYAGYLLGAAIIGFEHGYAGMISVSILISRWFNEHRGLAMGICMSASGLSAIIGAPVITFVINRFSMRTALDMEAGLALGAAVLLFFVVHNYPSEIGAEPIGAEHIAAEKVFFDHKPPKHLFILMMLSTALFGMPGNSLTNHLSVLYRSVGIDGSTVAALLSLMGGALVVGKLVYGEIVDRIKMYRASWLFYGMVIVGTALCSFSGADNMLVTIAGTAILSAGCAIITVSAPMYATLISTIEDYDANVIRLNIAFYIGGLIFGPVPGMIADVAGDYRPSYVVMTVLVALGAAARQYYYKKIRHSAA